MVVSDEVEPTRSTANQREEQKMFERTCAGKERFPTEAAVEAAIKLYRSSHRTFRLSAYRCRFCDRWHIGN